MTTLNPVLSSKTFKTHKQFHRYNPISFKPISCLSFKIPPPPFPSSNFSIKASFSSSSSSNPQNPNIQFSIQFPFSFLKPTLIAAITTAAIFVTRFYFKPRPAICAPLPVLSEQIDVKDPVFEKEIEKSLEENPNDVDGLKNLMEIKIKNKKLLDAMNIIDKLIELQPDEIEWSLLKSHLYVKMGDLELGKIGFHEILQKDPFRVEAYHGLIMVASEVDSNSNSIEELKEVEKKIEEGMRKCKKEGKKSEFFRDFRLLIAQIRVIEGKLDDGLKVYKELEKEEPRDFRPYLCQGLLYTLLGRENEAEKCFKKYRRLVPKWHPYARYIDENMIATKDFAQKMVNQRGESKS